jgi:Tfp pilus assembly protein PilV
MKLKFLFLITLVSFSALQAMDNEAEDSQTSIRKSISHIDKIRKMLSEYEKPESLQTEIYEYYSGYASDDVRPGNFWRIHQDNLAAIAQVAVTFAKAKSKTIAEQLTLFDVEFRSNPSNAHINKLNSLNSMQELKNQYNAQFTIALENQTILNKHRK